MECILLNLPPFDIGPAQSVNLVFEGLQIGLCFISRFEMWRTLLRRLNDGNCF